MSVAPNPHRPRQVADDRQAQAHPDDWNLLFAAVGLRLRSHALAAAPDNPLVQVVLDCVQALDTLKAMRDQERQCRPAAGGQPWQDWGSP